MEHLFHNAGFLNFILVPIPTFILGPSDMETAEFYSDVHGSGGELCENLTYLGKWKQLLVYLCSFDYFTFV